MATTAKRSPRYREKKKSTTRSTKKTAPTRSAPKSRRARTRKPTRISARQAAEARMIQQYHDLVDKKLQGLATPEDLAALHQIKTKMQSLAGQQTSAFEAVLDQRHNALMEKLTALTDELRRFPAASEAS